MTHPQQPDAQLTPLKRAFLALEEMQQKLDAAQKAAKEPAAREPVAVIGVGCRFPGGVNTPAAYWELLRRGGQAVSEPPPGREAVVEGVGGSLRAGWLQEPVDHFDPHFFGIAPREAHGMDPQQRLLLEVAWEALESACQAPDRLEGTRTGVYVGVSANDYLHVYLKEADAALFDGYYASGISHSIASGRLSYLLGLQGPSISLDTACSSSLSAVHLAVQSLRSGETDMALAGGVHLMLAPENFLAFDRFGMLAADGSCKTFDAAADGFGRGEGCGVVVLKRLSDAVAHGDRILAVIRGSAMNQDGASSGLTAPNGPAQEAVVRTALEQAGIDPALVSFIETHGTGTSLGDPIEVQALGAVFGPSHSAQQPLLLGAVKASLGHTEAAAGVAGLIKLVLSLQHGEIPPQANFHTPSPFIPWAKLPFVVPLQATAWPPVEGRRIGGISAFGFSGTNVHVVVEAAPEARLGSQTSSSAGEQAAAEDERPLHLLALSARQPAALAQLAGRYAGSLEAAKEARLRLADICYSANSGRAHLPYRLTVVGASTAEMAQKLAAFAAGEEAAGALSGLAEGPKPKIAFLFTGQGAQYAGMGRQLYATQPVFRAALDRCDAILRQHLAVPLLEVIDPPAEAASRLDDTTYTQPALFAIEYALAQLWQSWGVMPNFVMGHSIGELVAATVAGVFSLEDGLKLVAARGRLMGALPTGGAMAAVFAGESRVAAAIAPHAKTVAIAALNGPDSTVISGRGEDVEIILDHLRAEGIKARPLKVSHAFHSPLMEPMLEPFAQVAAGIAYAAPRIRLVSNVTGEVAPGMTVANAAYWRDHARAPVRFAAAIETLQQQGVAVFLEIGPGSTLIGMGERCLVEAEDQPPLWRASLKPSAGDWASLLESVAALYRAGVPIDWEAVDGRTGMRRVELPTYPFQRQRYWLPHLPGSRRSGPGGAELHPLLGRRLHSALPGAQFEKELGADAIAYLNDHRVQGAAILPGAGFMEAALAAAALVGGGLSVHDMLLLETLAVPDGARRVVQWIVTPQGEGEYKFACYSRETGESDDWRLHAEARLAPAASGLAGALAARFDLAALQTALPEVVEAEAHYAQLAANGLDFGPSLLGVTRLWRRDGEALGHIAPTECVAAEAQAYHLHPALLDAHLQVMAAAMPPQAAAHLPFSLDALRVLLPGVQPVWSHVVVHSSGESGATVRADLHLLGDRGEVVAILDGLHLKRLESGAGGTQSMAPFAGWLYEVEWVAQGVEDAGATARTAGVAPRAADVASAWPALPAVGEDVARRLEELEDEHQLATYALDVAPLLDRLSMAYIVAALRKLGWEPQTGEHFTPAALAQSLGIAQRHLRLLGRLCEILAEEGVLTADGVGWQVAGALTAEDAAEVERSLRQRHGAYAAEIDLVARCGRQLAEALSGRIDPVHLLFPQGDLSTTEALYRESPSARVYNGLMRATVEMLVVRRNAGLQTSLPAALAVVEDRSLTLGDMKPLRVLEIGGGTGGTTAYLLPMLPAEQTSYLFTDISPLFVARAEEKFGPHHEFASFAVLDLEKDPAQQGLGEHQFDLIVAANVVHATADLRKSLAHIRRLLAPDGLLVMLEVTGPQRWVDVTFGLTDGWWRFVDADLRPGYPLLAIAQWKELLESCGFDAVVTAPGEDGAGFIDQAVIMAHQPFGPGALLPGSAGAAADLGHWLVLADHGGTGEQLAQQLAQAGAGVTVAFAGAADMHQADGSFQVDPMQPEQIRGLMHSWSGQAGEKTLAGVVYLWGLDTPAGELDAKALAGTLAPSTAGALHLVQALAAHTGEATPRVWFVTRGAQAVTHAGDLPSVAQSPLWGFVQAVTLEHPELRPVLVDLDGAGAQADMAVDVNCLMAELLPARRGVSGVDDSTAGDAEDRVAWRAGQRFVARLEPRRITSRRQGGAQARQLEITQRGTLEGLALRALERRQPGRGEVEIRVHAAGLNFKDVLKTLGMVAGDDGPLGGECAGEVVAVGEGVSGLAVGQRVLAIAPGALRSHAVGRAELVAALPAGMSYAEGASIPIAFVTAAYTLEEVGRLQAGERVLIHAAAGGVGLAAVQIAQRLGAEVIATAGSEKKRDYLRSLGVAHVFDSRTLAFAGQIKELTGGRGVDLVLNSLAGDFIAASLSLLAPGGRFVEIGKSGLLTAEQAAALGQNRQYFIVDWTTEALENPALIRSLLDSVLAAMAEGLLKPLPHRLFGFEDAQAAFRLMAQAGHIGKIVLVDGSAQVEAAPVAIRGDATYLITGGLRGLGLLAGEWLAGQGARSLVLAGRSAPGEKECTQIEALRSAGCRVLVVQADVARREDVERLLATIANSPPGEAMAPLAGVVHAAGVLDDGVLIQQNWRRFETVMAPKVHGAWHLHQLTQEQPLDFFVMFSSLASLFGSPGQANHSAANAFLDALAHYRRGQGLPATSINWGIWSEVGIAAQLAAMKEAGMKEAGMKDAGMQGGEHGLGTISPQNGLRVLQWILEEQPAQIGVTPVMWAAYLRNFGGGRRRFFADVAVRQPAVELQSAPAQIAALSSASLAPKEANKAGLLDELAGLTPARRRTRLIEWVKVQAGQVLGLDPQLCGERTPLSEQGLDSLMAVELRNLLSQRLGLKRSLPATLVFDYPTIQAIADYLLSESAGLIARPAEAAGPGVRSVDRVAPVTPDTGVYDPGAQAAVLDDLETLTDEEVERRLAQQSRA